MTLKKFSQTTVVAFLMFSSSFSKGQAGMSNPEDIEKIKAQTLLIMIEEPKEELLAKLKPEEQEIYKQDITTYNEMMRNLFPKIWTLSTDVDFKTRKEIMALIKAKDANYAYLEYEKYKVQFANALSFRATFQTGSKDDLKKLLNPAPSYAETTIAIRFTEKPNTSLEVISIRMPSAFPTKGEMACAVKQIEYTFTKKMEGIKNMALASQYRKEAKRLANMTLLINKDDIDASEDAVKEVYAYPYEIINGKERQDLAMISGDSAYAVISVIPVGNGQFSYRVFATDGTLLAIANSEQERGVSIGGIAAVEAGKSMVADQIKKDHFKIISNQVRDSIKFKNN